MTGEIDRAWALLMEARWDEAVAVLSPVIGRDPRARVHRAIGLRQLGRLDEAQADLNAAVAADPRNDEAYHERGVLLLTRGLNREALADLDRAIAVAPTASRYSDRGAAYKQLGRYVEAAADLRRAVELDPELAWAHFNLGAALAQSGDVRAAVAPFRRARALGLEQAQPALQQTLGLLFVAATDDGSNVQAVEVVLQARDVHDIADALERFPFLEFDAFLDILRDIAHGAPEHERQDLLLRIEALQAVARG